MRLARAYDEAHADADARRERHRRAAVQAPGDRRRQVLDVQARAQPRLRVAGVPRRQRLRRGVGHAAPVPRGAAGLDLGGLGQRDEPRRAARADALAALARGVLRTRSSRRRAPTRAWTRASTSSKAQFADPATLETRARRVVEGMALCLQGSLLVRHAPAGGRRRLLRLAPGRRRRPRVRHAAGRQRLRGDHRAQPAARLSAAARRRRRAARRAPRLPWPHGAAHELPARPHLRHPHRRQRQLVRRAVLLHLLSRRLLPRTARRLAARPPTWWRSPAVLAFFASLVLHELGHALVARRAGHRRSRASTCGFFGGHHADATRARDARRRSSRSRPPGPLVTLAA